MRAATQSRTIFGGTRKASRLATICNALSPGVATIDVSELSAKDIERLRNMAQGPVLHDTVPVVLGVPILLRDAGPGLYLHEGTLIMKTEYFSAGPVQGRRRPDCYIVETGEYFIAGGPDVDMALLAVTPVSIKLP